MGHRKHSQPRRGSMAYYPRKRAKSMEARIRGWPASASTRAPRGGDKKGAPKPRLLAHAGFKAGCVQLVTIDDREHTPNAGKQLVSAATVIVTPPVFVLGIRGYKRDSGGRRAAFDVYAEDVPKEFSKYMPRHVAVPAKGEDGGAGAAGAAAAPLERARAMLGGVEDVVAVLAVSPRAAGLEQKRPYIFESAVDGGDAAAKFEYLSDNLGRHVRVGDVLDAGSGVDVAAITKGKGWQGVIQRMGAKRKQHKSRKTDRERRRARRSASGRSPSAPSTPASSEARAIPSTSPETTIGRSLPSGRRWPRPSTTPRIAVAAIADRSARRRSVLFILLWMRLLDLGGCACLPPLVDATSPPSPPRPPAPFAFMRATRDLPWPVGGSSESAELSMPAVGWTPFGWYLCESSIVYALWTRSRLNGDEKASGSAAVRPAAGEPSSPRTATSDGGAPSPAPLMQ